MEEQPPTSIQIDLDSLPLCRACLRVVLLVLVQGYLFWLYLKELIKQDKTMYDRLDVACFVTSLASLGTAVVATLGWGVAIGGVGHLCRLAWGLVLLLVFLRCVFRRRETGLCFMAIVLAIGVYFGVMMYYKHTIPIRYSLLSVYLLIGIVCL